MRLRLILITLVILSLLSGCASISKEECANADWEAMGYRDGSKGRPAAQFDKYQKSCVKHGFSVDFSRYMEGHSRGLEEVFCKPRNAYQLGLKGAGYNNVCPAGVESEFMSAYNYGRDIHKIQKSYNMRNQQRVALNNRLSKLDEHIAGLEQITRNEAMADHPESAHELRDERTATTALYERMKGMRQHEKQFKFFEAHLWQEYTAQNQRVERCTANIVGQSNLTPVQRRTIRTIADRSVEKGHLESRVNWIRSNPVFARSYLHKSANMREQLKELILEINTLKQELHRHPFTIQEKMHLAHNIELAEYAGALQHHREALTYRRNTYAWHSLIDIHFDTKMAHLNQRIDFARNHLPSKEARAARQAHLRELHEARRQRSDDLGELEQMDQELGQMMQKIDQMKSESGY